MVTIAMPQMGHDLFRVYMKSKYVQSLRRAGARVVWISLKDNPHVVEDALKCDGLLLPGGADVAPALYGETPEEHCGKPHLLRDTWEPKLLDAFLKADKPVLGICRGMQLMNVTLGGTLHQHIVPMQMVSHMDFAHRGSHTHKIELRDGTKLGSIFSSNTMMVNSMHHQAVKELGKGLVVSAVSEDGFVEGIELADNPFCLAVQWHPEHMSQRNQEQRKLFQAFVDACRKG